MDFAQAGPITTLQHLNPAHTPGLEAELEEDSRARPITLILPCHASELEQPATLQHLCSELAGARWLREVIVAMNGLGAAELARARSFFTERLPLPTRVLWSDGPRLTPLLQKIGLSGVPTGKALNVWAAIGVVCAEERSEFIATQDCDVRSFRRETLARLCHACVHPGLDFAFAKLFYARVTDRLYGRVSRLLLAPLLRSVQTLGECRGLIEFLLAFRYPLAGECALRRDLAAQLQTHDGWGLEIGMLCETYRCAPPERVCQVEGADIYDHRHHPLESGVLEAMAAQVAGALFTHLRRHSKPWCSDALASRLTAQFRAEAADAIRRSAALALINGLPFDWAGEEALASRFVRQLEMLVENGETLPHAIRDAPSWSELLCRAEVRERFLEAVAADQLG